MEEGEIPPSLPFPSQSPLPQYPGVTLPGWSSSALEGGGQFSPLCPIKSTIQCATCTAQVHHCGEGAVVMQGAETCALSMRLHCALLGERCAEHMVCWLKVVSVA